MDFKQLLTQAQNDLKQVSCEAELESWRIKYLGRKSDLASFFKTLQDLPDELKKRQGQQANEARQQLQELYQKASQQFSNSSTVSILDYTRPGKKITQGHLHPLTLSLRKIIKSFEKLGFLVVEGPEIETEYYHFDALRIFPDHPARDMWNTFWLDSKNKTPSARKTKKDEEKLLLRAHTSPVQIRYMEQHTPPLRIISPGRCFRYEATDATHNFQFYQVEGLMVDEHITLVGFKSLITMALKSILGDNILLRFRPSYFPFVTPGIEVDVKIAGKWIELLGAGMVHPDLFKVVGYENNKWQGFAFGLGVERFAMLNFKIDDIRLFYSSDVRFLEQF